MHYFDEWFNKTYCSDDYIPFLRKVSSTSNNNIDIGKRKASKAKKLKEIENQIFQLIILN